MRWLLPDAAPAIEPNPNPKAIDAAAALWMKCRRVALTTRLARRKSGLSPTPRRACFAVRRNVLTSRDPATLHPERGGCVDRLWVRVRLDRRRSIRQEPSHENRLRDPLSDRPVSAR